MKKKRSTAPDRSRNLGILRDMVTPKRGEQNSMNPKNRGVVNIRSSVYGRELGDSELNK